MTVYNPANQAELDAALLNAQSGDEIILADGSYGTLSMTDKSFASQVRIHPQNAGGAHLTRMNLTNVSNLLIDGLLFDDDQTPSSSTENLNWATNCQDIELRDSRFYGFSGSPQDDGWALVLTNCQRSTVIGCQIGECVFGLYVTDGVDTLIEDNAFDYVRSDDIRLDGVTGQGLSYEGELWGTAILNNTFSRNRVQEGGEHADCVQFFGPGKPAEHIYVRGNVGLSNLTGNMQGIFLADTNFDHVLIKQNVFAINNPRALHCYGTNILIEENTAINTLDGASEHVLAFTDGTARNNVLSSNSKYTTGFDADNNLQIHPDAQNPAYRYGAHYKGLPVDYPPSPLLGLTVNDFEPVEQANGGLAHYGSGVGAEVRINEILNPQGGSPMPLTLVSATMQVPAQGSVSFDSGGDVTVTPATDFVGDAVVDYTMENEFGIQASSTLTATFNAPTPTANPDAVVGLVNTPVTKNVLDNDVE